MTKILCLIFFFSGASALVFELLWFKLSGLTFGNSVWATTIVLCSFMAGLALGNGLAAFWGHKIRLPLRLYAFLEIAIAVTGVALVIVFPSLTKYFAPLFRSFSDHASIINLLRAVIAFTLMLVPATAMGATLPILVKALYAKNPNFGRVLGVLYGWNTLGAVAGVMAGEIFFIKWFGIKGSGIVAASFNLFAAAMAFWFSKKHVILGSSLEKGDNLSFFSSFSFMSAKILTASFLSGFSLLALEVIWFRFLLLFFAPNSWNFSVMLAMVLSGISFGGLFASKWFKIRPEAQNQLVPILFLNGMIVTVLYYSSYYALYYFNTFKESDRICMVALLLIFPVSLISGVIFTMLGKLLHGVMKVTTSATGFLTLANTIGAMLGSPFAALIFIPVIGIEKTFFLVAFLYGIIAIIMMDRKQFIQLKRINLSQSVLAISFVISLCLFPFDTMNNRFLEITCSPFEEKYGEKKVATRESATETIQYLQKDIQGEPAYHRLLTNNYSMSATTLIGKRYMKLFVYLPVAIHPEPKNALLVCFGVGSTAKALVDTKGFEHIDMVDISRDILDMSEVVFRNPEENPVNDSRVKTHIEDGRYFLLTTEKKYDLITGEPPPPKMSGVVNLYSQEYFQLIYDRLADGGIVTYWLPVYQLKVSEAKLILKSFSNVFKDCSLWSGAGLEWMMVGVKNPQKPVSDMDFSRQWNDPVVGSEMRSLGFQNPESLGALFIASYQRLRNWTSDSLPLVDNYPGRLSYASVNGDVVKERYRPVYVKFADYGISRADFMKSEHISRIWPESLRRKANKYFPVQPKIDEMLSFEAFGNKHVLLNINSCIRNPLMKNYILWAFGSNEYEQGIISKVLKVAPEERSEMPSEILEHLAAGAVREHNYLLAENYLRLAAGKLGLQDKVQKYTKRLYYTVARMFLLFISGKEEQAERVGQDYILAGKTDKDKRRRKIDYYWSWIISNASPDIRNNPG